MKKWQKILIGVIVVCVALIAANGLTMKGFCYTLSYPGGEMIFMEKGHCYVGLPGSKKSEELSGVSYTGRPQKLSDTKDVSDTYKTVLWTFVSVDQGRWVGVHFLNRSFLVQTSGFTRQRKSLWIIISMLRENLILYLKIMEVRGIIRKNIRKKQKKICYKNLRNKSEYFVAKSHSKNVLNIFTVESPFKNVRNS